MERSRILIIGKNGQVGWELCRTLATLSQVTAVDYPELDLCDGQSVRDLVRGSVPDVIVNAAAYTAVDKAESEPERALQINGAAPGVLAAEAAASGALLVHYSTDYVYAGDKGSGYQEHEKPNPLSQYGRSKWAGDAAVLESGCRHLIFRLCWVYGARGHNFMRTIMRLAAEREQLRIVSDQVGCPTWSRMIAEATAMAVRQSLGDRDPARFNGVYHLAASGQCSWYEFAQAIVNSIPADLKKCSMVQPIATAEYPLPARRPAFSVLDCGKLERTFGVRLPHWRDSLAQVLEEIRTLQTNAKQT